MTAITGEHKVMNSSMRLLVLCMLALVVACTPISQADAEKGKPGVATAGKDVFWPPKLNYYYPNLTLLDQDGKKVSLSQFKGKVIIVEPVGISCPACQAFAGGNRLGSFQGVTPQSDLRSFEEYAQTYAGVKLDNPKIVFVQLILYNMNLQAPSLAEAQAWSKHFQMSTSRNRYVLAGEQNMVGNASYNMIPGFQLIDQNFVLRSDSTGHNPTNDLYRHLLPTLKSLL